MSRYPFPLPLDGENVEGAGASFLRAGKAFDGGPGRYTRGIHMYAYATVLLILGFVAHLWSGDALFEYGS
jgi:hypothetical protein